MEDKTENEMRILIKQYHAQSAAQQVFLSIFCFVFVKSKNFEFQKIKSGYAWTFVTDVDSNKWESEHKASPFT